MSNLPALPIYVINLESAIYRYENTQRIFAEAALTYCRVEAIDGKTLAWGPADYAEKWYRSLHGRETNPSEIACYLSHLKALRLFLRTDAELALICEDDLDFGPNLASLLLTASASPRWWNILRLSGVSGGRPLRVTRFHDDHWLCINIGRIKGSGAYLIDRTAADAFIRQLPPMVIPYDHAIDREWFYGLTAACLCPFPILQRQERLGSDIQTYAQPKLPALRRWLTTYPYQACNETSRWICRGVFFLWVKLSRSKSLKQARNRSKR